MILLDGKKLAGEIKQELAQYVQKNGIMRTLAVVIVGDDAASRVYVNGKKADCAEVGIKSLEFALPESTSQKELEMLVDSLNSDENVDGILVQLPLPKHLNENAIINRIAPEKDVDAFHPENVGKIMLGTPRFLPCTPAGVMELIKLSGVEVAGRECVVVGRSNIVGKPLAMLLLKANGTVTVAHSKTKNLAEVCQRADILVAAVGKPNLIIANMVKEGAVVIDVGINRLESGKLVGDVDFENVAPKCAAITPVPGGVGPMTRAMLMKNVVQGAD